MSTSSKLGFLTPRVRLGVVRTIENDFPPLSSVRTRFGQVSSPPPPVHPPPTHTRTRSLSLCMGLRMLVCVCVHGFICVCSRGCECRRARELCVSMCARLSPFAPGLGCVCDEVGILLAVGHPSETAC